MTQNTKKGYIHRNQFSKGYPKPKSLNKGYLKKGYIAAILPALWVMGCNSGGSSTTGSVPPLQGVSVSVISHPNSTFYVKQTEGPKYEAIQVLNSSPYTVSLSSVSLPSGVSVESNIAYYNSNTACGISGGVVLAESGGSCVLLLKSTSTTLGSTLSTINISGSASSGALFSQAINLSSSYTMYAGGEFSQIGGVSASNGNYLLAQYNGNTWSDAVVNGDPNGMVRAIAFDTAGNLYTGGLFSTIGGESIDSNYFLLAVESTGGWGNAVANGQNAPDEITTIAFDQQDNLYTAGHFSTIGGIPPVGGSLLAVESSGGWGNAVANGLNANQTIQTIAFDASGNLYVGGYFQTIGGITPVSGDLLAVESSGGWSNAVANGMNAHGSIMSIAFDASNKMYVGGEFESIAGVSVSTGYLIAQRSDGVWSNANGNYNPNNRIGSIAFDGNNNLYAGGWFTTIGGISGTYTLLASRNANSDIWTNLTPVGLSPNYGTMAIAFGNTLSAVVVPQ